jgi:protein CpxP
MRKTIIMGLGLALSLAGTAAAQQPGQEGQRRPKAEGERGEKGRGRFGAGGFLFRDITLTDAQKTQLQELRRSGRDAMTARRDEMKRQFDEARAARQRGDTTAARAIMERSRQQMAQLQEQRIVAMRNVLTAEQRVQFDKNVAEMKQRRAERGDRPRGERGPRRGKARSGR